MKNIKFWTIVLDELKRDQPVILLIVVNTEGRTPGQRGFKLVLTTSGRIDGTIGGGQLEFALIEKAKLFLPQEPPAPLLEDYSLSPECCACSDQMICGGKQTMLFYRLVPAHRSMIEQLISILQSHQPGVLKFTSAAQFQTIPIPTMALSSPHFAFKTAREWEYLEPIGMEPVVHIIGGGHVALALSQVLSLLNYYLIVYDERHDVATFVNNLYADEKKCLPFAHVHEYIEATDRTCVVIMTPGHQSDECVLRNLITKNVRYIGMLASPKKRQEIVNKLLQDGFDANVLKKLHSPIGLPINSHTPAEIAVSIAAELVKVNNEIMG